MDMETTSDPIDSIEHTVAFSSSASERKKAVRAALELEGLPAKRLAGLIVCGSGACDDGAALGWNAVLDDALRKTSPAHAIECIGELAADARVAVRAVRASRVRDRVRPSTRLSPARDRARDDSAVARVGGRTGCRARALEGAVRRVERMLCAHRAALVPLAVRVVRPATRFVRCPRSRARASTRASTKPRSWITTSRASTASSGWPRTNSTPSLHSSCS